MLQVRSTILYLFQIQTCSHIEIIFIVGIQISVVTYIPGASDSESLSHPGSCMSMASRRGEFERRVLGNFSYPIVNPGSHFKFVPSGPIFQAHLPGPHFQRIG
jgi:hypothetical protein